MGKGEINSNASAAVKKVKAVINNIISLPKNVFFTSHVQIPQTRVRDKRMRAVVRSNGYSLRRDAQILARIFGLLEAQLAVFEENT